MATNTKLAAEVLAARREASQQAAAISAIEGVTLNNEYLALRERYAAGEATADDIEAYLIALSRRNGGR